MPRHLGDRLGERPVAVVDVQVVVALEIVGDVEIGAAVTIEIAGDDAESEAIYSVVDPGGVGDVGEVVAVVAEQSVAGARTAIARLRPRLDSALGVRRVVEQVHVEVAVTVVVEEERLGRVSNVLEPVLPGAIGEGSVAVVDVEDIATVLAKVVDAGDVDVDQPVAVDVGHGDAGLPTYGIRHPCFFGDVLEAVVPKIAIELVGTEVGGEVEIGEPVAVDVTDRDAGAVVVVQVVEDVEVGLLGQRVRESNARCFWLQELKQRWLARLLAPLTTGQHAKHYEHQKRTTTTC